MRGPRSSPTRLGRIALAFAVVPVLIVIAILNDHLTTGPLVVIGETLLVVPGPIAVILGQIAATRWRREKASGLPWAALLACLLGGIETTLVTVLWLGAWPGC